MMRVLKMDINHTVESLLQSKIHVYDIEDESVINLRAVGRQFALRYRHSKDKESKETLHILNTLVNIRKIVKQRLGVTDTNMQRFEEKEF